MKYEIFKKQDLATRKGLPISTHYTLDAAMETCKEKSKGTTKEKVYNEKLKTPSKPYGDYEEMDVPVMVALIERGDKQSRIRGWGINGKFHDAKDCKRCKGSGQDQNAWQLLCQSCAGAGYKPKV